jgi:hypothetical protein
LIGGSTASEQVTGSKKQQLLIFLRVMWDNNQKQKALQINRLHIGNSINDPVLQKFFDKYSNDGESNIVFSVFALQQAQQISDAQQWKYCYSIDKINSITECAMI